MSGGGGKKVVCVTGGSGYIASRLIKHLLQRGYTVKATVRDTSDPKKTDHLLALDGAKERLQLFNANLLEEGSFDAAVDGCEGVFHTASPVIFFPADPQAEVLDPAVKGTLNVLKSCARVQSIKRVILTSSISAVVFDQRGHTPDLVMDESFYSDTTFCRKQKLWYPLSKTLAEEAARNFAEENGLDLVIINPGYVIGPFLQPTLNITVEMILNLVGAQAYPDAYYKSCDVRDVADVHIQAFEIPSASGRYCLLADVTHFTEVVKIIGKQFPTLHLPEKCEAAKFVFSKSKVSKEKVKTLGISFIPLEVTLRDTIESLIEKGVLHV
ncbi:hypothetical protein Tsubulata_032286 [Turnera subulata]|uniref:NAD-dependent epimerase/dehydratase domain-containing protein n=1 Tax=Turnera subulata TaxID=218843 RepID=A0A9Q0J1K9_9ROSI|nr:hypothetical protein Tsubulata_032286 [Turnera subulata]